MPLYLYRCRECGHKFEMLRRLSDSDSEIECPRCGKKEPEKVIMPFYGSSGTKGAAASSFRFG